MDHSGSSPSTPPPPPASPPPPGYGPPPPYGYAPPPPPQSHRVHITASSGGFVRALWFIIALILFAGVFVCGIVIGVAVMFAGSSMDQVVLEEPYQDGFANARIAVIPVEGVIEWNMSEFVRDCTDHVLSKGFDAVVLRVDSPGGGVTSSDQIWYEVQRMQSAGLPVVASYGGLAASGGYYVSCSADHITAEPTCITGSIGVIAQVLTFESMLDKVGIEPVTLVASGSPQKDVANDIFHSWNEQDRQKIIDVLDASYETFISRVAEGRGEKIAVEAGLPAVADGSIFTADQAKSNGLIDSIGYLDDAIVQAEVMIGVSAGSSDVVVLRYPPSLFGDGLLLQARHRSTAPATLDAEAIRTFANELASPRLMYLMH